MIRFPSGDFFSSREAGGQPEIEITVTCMKENLYRQQVTLSDNEVVRKTGYMITKLVFCSFLLVSAGSLPAGFAEKQEKRDDKEKPQRPPE